MIFTWITIAGIVLMILLLIILLVQKNKSPDLEKKIDLLQIGLKEIEINFKDDFKMNREESAQIARDNRNEIYVYLKDFSRVQEHEMTILHQNQKEFIAQLKNELKEMALQIEKKLDVLNQQARLDNAQARETISSNLKDFQTAFSQSIQSINELQKDKFAQIEVKQNDLIQNTEKRLEQIRTTVEEKLQQTLSERLGQSFELVGKQLESVQKGLGEMQILAQDVGGLKRVLSNVKMRGGFGEMQLAMLLEQILAPDQYASNVKTKIGSNEHVEFAIKLPGRKEDNSTLWLPIDAKFPRDIYEQLQFAYDKGDLSEIEKCQKNLEIGIRKMAKDISDKYIDPPHTTDFAILFLPFEGIYAEVVRKTSLLEDLQRNYKIIVTGPTTLAAILNSLQIGFKTLAIQKRSGEVWQVLAQVKKEFGIFGGLLEKAQNNIKTGLGQLDNVIGVRTRAIVNKLKKVESLSEIEEEEIFLPEIKNELPLSDNDYRESDDEIL